MTFVICFDTMCQGYQPIIDEHENPIEYETIEEAEKDLNDDPQFYQDCFIAQKSEIGRKAIYHHSNKRG